MLVFFFVYLSEHDVRFQVMPRRSEEAPAAYSRYAERKLTTHERRQRSNMALCILSRSC